jgi:hypothetical protein
VRANIKTYLQTKFSEVASVAKPKPASIVVEWSETKPAPTNTDMLVYFVPTNVSINSKFTGKLMIPMNESHWGQTNWKNGGNHPIAVTEVFAKSLDPDVLGAMAFHEVMHMKLLLPGSGEGDNNLHNHGGLAAAKVNGTTILTERNKQELAANLTRKVDQWIDGFDILLSMKARRDGGDELWDAI